MRAMTPDHDGFVDHDGVKIGYEVFGDRHGADPTVVFLPGWQVSSTRSFKGQVPYFAARWRVVTVDLPGAGRSDRPTSGADYAPDRVAAQVSAVLDATATERAVVVGLSAGGTIGLVLAAAEPHRVVAVVTTGSFLPVTAEQVDLFFSTGIETHARLAADPEAFYGWFIASMLPEAHSTKVYDDVMGWAHETTPEVLLASLEGTWLGAGNLTEIGPAVRDAVRGRPVLVVHGSEDAICVPALGRALAEGLDGELVMFEGSGHLLVSREPVRFNHVVGDFIERRVRGAARSTTRRWSRGLARPKRALFLSSPIGLGHGRRDLAIADELRRLVPDLSVEWLTQHPVSALLEARGEQVHPASGHLVSESAHIESECGEHDLHAFQALRTMDEVLVANFHVFDDLLEEEQFDLVVADEAWDVDHFLHENPELKRSPLVWLTDFVGSVPMAAGGEREAYLTADYNAEMLEHVERFGWLRDRSIFVGDPDDVVPLDFGPGLPSIRAWTNEHFDFAGYVSGFTPPDRDEARAALGWQDGEPVCVVTVGGSGVGGALLRRVLDAVPAARRAIDGLRVVIVTGPRLDPASIPATAGVEVHGFLPDLPRWLAGCDLAMVQGGLTTCMELVASQVPFVYFPLANHFEQQVHVRHRLDRYGAGRCLQYADSPPDLIGQAMVEEVGRRVEYRPVSTDGAARSARLIAELL